MDIGGPVSFLDFGGEGTPLVCIHGLGGSGVNWIAVGDRLAALGHRVLAPDLRGFGRTPLDGHRADVDGNQRLLDRFLRERAGGRAILVGNSMGGLISVLQAARHPETVQALLLVDPALPWRGRRPFDLALWVFFAALLVPGLAERSISRTARRQGAERLVAETLRVVCADPSRVPAEAVRAHVQLAEERANLPGGEKALGQAARSLLAVLRRPRRFDAVYRAVRGPVRIVHGDRDRLIPVDFSVGLAACNDWRVDILPDLGHVPMLEDPDGFVRVTRRWLGAIGHVRM